MKLRKADIKLMGDTELFSAFHWSIVRSTNEQNSRTGLTQQTAKECKWILEECMARFNLEREVLVQKHIISE